MRVLIATTVTVVCCAAPLHAQSCSLEGVWQLVASKIDGQAQRLAEQQIKMITNGRFTWVTGSADSVNTSPVKASGTYRAFKSLNSGGGTYTLEGNTYTEHIEYFPDVAWIGLSLPFTCMTQGDRLVQSGALPVFENGTKVRDIAIEESYRRLDSPQTAIDVQTVANAVRAYRDAWLANDVLAIVAHLDEEVVISTPSQPDLRGRTAVQQAWDGVLATSRVKELVLREEPITVSGDLAIAPGEFDEIVEVQGQTEPMRLNGRYLTVWRRGSDGVWRILRFMSVDRTGIAQ